MKNDLETVTYAPGSPLKEPGLLFREMRRDLAASGELAWRLFVRNLSSRYRQTILGYVWAFVPPLFTTLVFVFLRNTAFFKVPDTKVDYFVFLLTGVILWEAFADALNSPVRMVGQSTSMLAKVNFPREALVIAGIGEVLFSLVIRLGLLAVALAWFRVELPWTAVWFPFGVLTLIALGVALGVLLTPAAILYHDVAQGLHFLLFLWMFLTPVIYPAPTTASGSWTMLLNPVSPVLDTARAWLLTGSPDHLTGFVVVSVLSGMALLLGWVLYRLALPVLIERMSA